MLSIAGDAHWVNPQTPRPNTFRSLWSELEALFGQPSAGTWKRYLAAKVPARNGRRLRQRDVPTTPAGSRYAKKFIEEHADCDTYFTPCTFKHTRGGKRTATQAAWVSWIWLDIDGVPGARTGGEAWAKLADALDDLRIPQPNYVFCTSEKPDDPDYLPRLQVYWKIVPLYVGNPDARRLWRKVAGMLADVLAAARFNVDRGASTNLTGLMRLPGSVNSKTSTRVETVGPTHSATTTLTELVTAKTPTAPRRPTASPSEHPKTTGRRGRLTELPQVKTLARGVPAGLRNLALFTLSKAAWADSVPLEEAIEWALDWNDTCDPPEDPAKIKDVIHRCYGARGPQADPAEFKAIDPAITAAVVTELTGEKAEPDLRLRTWFPHPTERQASWQPTETRHRIAGRPIEKPKRRRGRVRQTGWDAPLNRYVHTATKLAKSRKGSTFTQGEVAKAAGVSRQTIARRWPSIQRAVEAKIRRKLQRSAQGYHVPRLTGNAEQNRDVNPNDSPTMTLSIEVSPPSSAAPSVCGRHPPWGKLGVDPPLLSPSAVRLVTEAWEALAEAGESAEVVCAELERLVRCLQENR